MLGETIKTLRKERAWSQAQFAACLAALTALLAYLTVENLGEWIKLIAGRG